MRYSTRGKRLTKHIRRSSTASSKFTENILSIFKIILQTLWKNWCILSFLRKMFYRKLGIVFCCLAMKFLLWLVQYKQVWAFRMLWYSDMRINKQHSTKQETWVFIEVMHLDTVLLVPEIVRTSPNRMQLLHFFSSQYFADRKWYTCRGFDRFWQTE